VENANPLAHFAAVREGGENGRERGNIQPGEED